MTKLSKAEEPVNMVTIYLRKDGKTLDMRYKSNRQWVKKLTKPWWWQKLQWLADKMGAKNCGFGSSGVWWGHWFNPWYQLHRLAWKLGIMWPYKL